MTKTLKKGDHVTWNTSQGKTEGTVVKKLTAPKKIKSHQVEASKEHPQYEVKSAKTGAHAAHKASALHKA